ncbi:YdcF family protein [Listeria rustica]|uniref:YdcF family protein n=1 Tax=Listeria rustica TaxID=2713503 RepID=A0A7W1YFM3_9LIST|nr:YdcF family protein [Listeria rustica]MBA3925802.1 YdcF family protein [Listeria rustica]
MVLAYIAGFFIILFLILFIIDKRRVSNGIFLTLALFFTILAVAYGLMSTDSNLIALIVVGVFFLILALFPFLIVGLGIGLVYNGRLMAKREGRKIPNLLTLFVGIMILALIVLIILQITIFDSVWLSIFFTALFLILGYFSFLLFSFLTSSYIYQYNRPRLQQDFIIVLGSGLIDGNRVPPLLASRLDRAIVFYYKQAAKKFAPQIIVSGGQGPNELVSEAFAMKNYLLDKGIPEDHVLMEDLSVNTLQNMRFSKTLMDDLKPKYRSIFVTNNFHLFRASLYARKAGLKSQGISSKTALYYLPNALMREFIAIIVMYKKWHITVTALILLGMLAIGIVTISFG